jgi:hypothetical protein
MHFLDVKPEKATKHMQENRNEIMFERYKTLRKGAH